VNRWWW